MCGRSWGRFYSLVGGCSDYAFQRAVTSGCMMVDKVKLFFFLNQPSEDCKIFKQISHKIRRLSDYQSLNTRRRQASFSFAFTATGFSSNNECFGIVCCWDVLFPVCGLFSEFYSRCILPSSLIVQKLRYLLRDCRCPWCWNPSLHTRVFKVTFYCVLHIQ